MCLVWQEAAALFSKEDLFASSAAVNECSCYSAPLPVLGVVSAQIWTMLAAMSQDLVATLAGLLLIAAVRKHVLYAYLPSVSAIGEMSVKLFDTFLRLYSYNIPLPCTYKRPIARALTKPNLKDLKSYKDYVL